MEALFQLAIVWVSVFAASVMAEKTRLTPVLYFLAVGAVLVNTGILPEVTSPFIRGFADIGIITIMFALGFEESPANFLRSIRRSWGIAIFGALGPFLMAYVIADFFWDDVRVSLMCGLAMASTTVSLSMVSLKSEGLHKSRIATGIMSAAVIDNIASLVFIALVIPLATGQEAISAGGITLTVAKALGFFVIITVLGHWVFPHERPRWMAHIPLLGRFSIKDLLGVGRGEHATLTVLILAVGAGLLAHAFGLHPAVGAYMAGLIIKEEYFHLPKTPEVNSYKDTKRIIDSVAFSWIGPIFFVELGTKIVFDWDVMFAVIPHTVVLTAGLILAQIGFAALAARYTGNFAWEESLMIGFAMLGRAELAFVVMDIAYVQHQILSKEAFYMLMGAAFWMNVAVPVTIRMWKPYFHGRNLGRQKH